jgi:hypothetical protein
MAPWSPNPEETSEVYGEYVEAFSQRSQDDYLLSGRHYSCLARFLRGSRNGASKRLPSPAGSAGRQTSRHSFLTSINLYGDKEELTPTELSTPHHFLTSDQLSANCSLLLFLKGYPSPDWIKVLGTTFRVDPEFWRRHLEFLQSEKFYDLPSLPSYVNRSVQLRIVTIFNRHTAISRGAVEKARENAVETMRDHHLQLQRDDIVGESIIRRLDVHSENIFTIEQHVSCTVSTKNGGWAGK